MISLKRSMDLIEEQQSCLRAWLNVYKGILRALEVAADTLAEECGGNFREQVKGVRLELGPESVPQAIVRSGEKVKRGFSQFARQVAEFRD